MHSMSKLIDLYEGEKIVKVVRKHWFVFFVEMLLMALLAVLPAVLYYFFLPFIATGPLGEQFSWDLIFSRVGPPEFLYLVWLLVVWHVAAIIWTDYYLDIWVITNQRIIDIEQLGLFNRRVSAFRLDMLQDVTIEIPGLLATLIKFGNIHVQTAGDDRDFIMPGVTHPEEVKSIIMREHHAARERLIRPQII